MNLKSDKYLFVKIGERLIVMRRKNAKISNCFSLRSDSLLLIGEVVVVAVVVVVVVAVIAVVVVVVVVVVVYVVAVVAVAAVAAVAVVVVVVVDIDKDCITLVSGRTRKAQAQQQGPFIQPWSVSLFHFFSSSPSIFLSICI